MKNRFIRTGAFILGIFLVINLTRSLIDLWQKGGLLDKEEERFAKVRLENEELNKEFARLQTPEYIEREARDKLGLAREGEAVVIIPPTAGNQSNTLKETNSKEVAKPIWQQWLAVLIN